MGQELIGQQAYVARGIGRGRSAPGQVYLAGMAFTAYSVTPIAKGQMVEVVEMPAHRTVVVKKWRSWLNQ